MHYFRKCQRKYFYYKCVGSIYELARDLLQYERKELKPLSTDGQEGREFQTLLIDDAINACLKNTNPAGTCRRMSSFTPRYCCMASASRLRCSRRPSRSVAWPVGSLTASSRDARIASSDIRPRLEDSAADGAFKTPSAGASSGPAPVRRPHQAERE